jgi:hypothetical protein
MGVLYLEADVYLAALYLVIVYSHVIRAHVALDKKNEGKKEAE